MLGSFSDTSALRLYDFDLPLKSWITGDIAYNDYLIEDIMREAGLELVPLRKKNSSCAMYRLCQAPNFHTTSKWTFRHVG